MRERRFYILQATFDGTLLLFALCIFVLCFMHHQSGSCYASPDYDYPLTKAEIEEHDVTQYTNITRRFLIMLGIFVANFGFTLAVDLAKTCVRFDTQNMHRLLVVL